jgi:hypothetical protein
MQPDIQPGEAQPPHQGAAMAADATVCPITDSLGARATRGAEATQYRAGDSRMPFKEHRQRVSVFLDGWTGGVTEASPNKKLAATVAFLVSRLT